MKKSLLLLTFVVSGLSGMNHTSVNQIDYQRLPKRELVRILQNQRTEPVVIERIVEVEKIVEVERPTFVSRHKKKIIGVGVLGAIAGFLHLRKTEPVEVIVEDQHEEIIPTVQEEIVEVRNPSFISRHKKKLIFLATLAAAGYGGYHYFPEYYHNAYNHALTGIDMIKTLIQSKFIPQDNVQICKTLQNKGFFNRLFNGDSYETCTKANNMSFKEMFNSFFR